MLPLLFLNQSLLVFWSPKARHLSVPSQHGVLSRPLVGLYKKEKNSTPRLVPPSLRVSPFFMLNTWPLIFWYSKQAPLSLFKRSFAIEVFSVSSCTPMCWITCSSLFQETVIEDRQRSEQNKMWPLLWGSLRSLNAECILGLCAFAHAVFSLSFMIYKGDT